MSKTEKPVYEESVNEPNVVYVSTTDLKNRLGEVLDLALVNGKEVILRKHGREILKLTKLHDTRKNGKKLLDSYFGSDPDLKIDPNFRDNFTLLNTKPAPH